MNFGRIKRNISFISMITFIFIISISSNRESETNHVERNTNENQLSWIGEPAIQSPESRLPTTVVEFDPERAIYIGDVHGDIDAFRDCLEVARLIDDSGSWIGGKSVLVQMGDVFDRGDDDLSIEEWLYLLSSQAKENGGAVYRLIGNHEIMNAIGDHSYASSGSFKPFDDLKFLVSDWIEMHQSVLQKIPEWTWPRIASMIASGPVSQLMAGHSVAIKIGSTLVVHAGILKEHFEPEKCGNVKNGGIYCLEYLNKVASEYLYHGGTFPEKLLWGRDSPLWTRKYSTPEGRPMSKKVESELIEVLDAVGATRMIVGHTPQSVGINSAANGRLWRIDTGMTKMIGGPVEILEILNGQDIHILTKNGRVAAGNRSADSLLLPQRH